MLKLAQAMEEQPGSLILGCRNFGEDTPRRSAMGNRVTSFAMDLLYDIHLKDTQTGLPGGCPTPCWRVRKSSEATGMNMS